MQQENKRLKKQIQQLKKIIKEQSEQIKYLNKDKKKLAKQNLQLSNRLYQQSKRLAQLSRRLYARKESSEQSSRSQRSIEQKSQISQKVSEQSRNMQDIESEEQRKIKSQIQQSHSQYTYNSNNQNHKKYNQKNSIYLQKHKINQSMISDPSTQRQYNSKISPQNIRKPRIFKYNHVKNIIFSSLGRVVLICKPNQNSKQSQSNINFEPKSKWCTGFLITKNKVITTANTFLDQGKFITLQHYQIRFYPYILQNQESQQEKFIRVDNFHIHPKFQEQMGTDIEHRQYDVSYFILPENKFLIQKDHLKIVNECKIQQKQTQIALIGYNNKVELKKQPISPLKQSKTRKLINPAKINSYIESQNNNNNFSVPQKILKLSVYETIVQSIQQNKHSILFPLQHQTLQNQRKLIINRQQKHQGLSGSPILVIKDHNKNNQNFQYQVIGINKGKKGTKNQGILFINQQILKFIFEKQEQKNIFKKIQKNNEL